MVRMLLPLQEMLDKLERKPSFAAAPALLAEKRVLVAGLGPLAECVVNFIEQGIGSGGGQVKLLALPGEHPSGIEFGRWLAAQIPALAFQEHCTLADLDEALQLCDLVVDAGHYLDAASKCQLYRAARRQNRPVILATPTAEGATAYFFHPEDPIRFEELFSAPPESVRTGWRLPIGRLSFLDDAPSQFRLFQMFNGLATAPTHPMAREAVRLLTQQLVVGALMRQLVPHAPVACYLEPQQFSMGTTHVGRDIAEQEDSIWSRIASVYDEFLLASQENVYQQLIGKIRHDLAGCSRVLEAGCGTGSICQALAMSGIEAYGVDRNLAMLARASFKATCTPGMYVGDGDVQRLYFPDQYFDGYCSNNVVFDADIVLTLKEAHRVLKPGGKLAIASSQVAPNIQGLGAVPSYFDKLDPLVAREFVACQQEIYAGRSLKYGFQTHGASKVEQLLLDTGFSHILKSEVVYAGQSFYLVAQK